jgi:hypothetical protein
MLMDERRFWRLTGAAFVIWLAAAGLEIWLICELVAALESCGLMAVMLRR